MPTAASPSSLLDEFLSTPTGGASTPAAFGGGVSGTEMGSPLPMLPKPLPRPGIAKVSYTHDAMIDLILAKPYISQNELAAHFGYTASWISQIMSSDAFDNRLAERTKELVDPVVRASIEERFRAMVLRSLDILREKLDLPAHQVPDQLALRTLELSSKALGYGAKSDPTPPVQVNMDIHLEALGGNLVKLLNRKKGEVVPQEAEICSPSGDQK